MVSGDHVVTCVVTAMVGVGGAVVVVILRLLGLLPLAVLLILHPSVLKPNFDLPFGQVEVPGQLPPLLFGDVGVEEELLLQLQRLEFGIGLAFFPHCHLTCPF